MCCSSIFFFNDTATTEIYTLSLHDALPISGESRQRDGSSELRDVGLVHQPDAGADRALREQQDRKSTRLNSSHSQISYAVFCLKKKKKYLIGHLSDRLPQTGVTDFSLSTLA